MAAHKNELIAKFKHLGPFRSSSHYRVQRSADGEHVCSFETNLGDIAITYLYPSQDGESDLVNGVTLLIDSTPWEEYLNANGIDNNIHEEMRRDVLTLTRNFNHRVKMFLKLIVVGENNPMMVKFYNLIIEF